MASILKKAECKCIEKISEVFGDRAFTVDDAFEIKDIRDTIDEYMLLKHGIHWNGNYIPYLRCRRGIYDYCLDYVVIDGKKIYFVKKELSHWVGVALFIFLILIISTAMIMFRVQVGT